MSRESDKRAARALATVDVAMLCDEREKEKEWKLLELLSSHVLRFEGEEEVVNVWKRVRVDVDVEGCVVSSESETLMRVLFGIDLKAVVLSHSHQPGGRQAGWQGRCDTVKGGVGSAIGTWRD